MKPSLSLVFFTVLSGAGLGLLAHVAISALVTPDALSLKARVMDELFALALVAAGLASSLLHLANPRSAWRAFSRFRTSWLSREAVFAVALFSVCALDLAALLLDVELLHRVLSVALLALAWGVLLATANIYATLKPIRQWHTIWTPVNYFLLGHWSGALIFLALARFDRPLPASLALTTGVLGVIALIGKLAYWRSIADTSTAPTIERAIGVGQGVAPRGQVSARARLFDVGHSHGTFLTQEFGFVLARQHARMIRAAALILGFVAPLCLVAFVRAHPAAAPAAAVFGIIGMLAERWLFFAEARHTVRLYHGDRRA